MRTFKQLSQQDRVYISRLNARGMSISRIAVRLGVHKSTISRELRRNAQVSDTESQIFWIGVYNLWSRTEVLQYLEKLKAQGHPGLEPKRFWNASIAQDKRNRRLYLANQLRRRKSSETAKWVIQKLKEHWSPDQIAGRSKIAGPQPVSHEYVYQLIIQDKKNGGTLYRLLKRFRKRKQRFAKRTYGPVIPNRVSIENRPAIASTRSRLGDLEGSGLLLGWIRIERHRPQIQAPHTTQTARQEEAGRSETARILYKENGRSPHLNPR